MSAMYYCYWNGTHCFVACYHHPLHFQNIMLRWSFYECYEEGKEDHTRADKSNRNKSMAEVANTAKKKKTLPPITYATYCHHDRRTDQRNLAYAGTQDIGRQKTASPWLWSLCYWLETFDAYRLTHASRVVCMCFGAPELKLSLARDSLQVFEMSTTIISWPSSYLGDHFHWNRLHWFFRKQSL